MKQYLEYFVAFLIIVALWAWLTNRTEARQATNFSAWHSNTDLAGIYLLKHHKTQRCWIVNIHRGGIVETAPEVCN